MIRTEIISKLKKQVDGKSKIIGVATCSGMTAKYVQTGGADIILALNSSKFRQMGRSSLAGYLPFSNSNDLVMNEASREVLPISKNIPVIFGLNASDPTKNMDEYIEYIKNIGFSGINNYPTVGLLDGKFREYLEENNLGYEKEVEAISIAKQKDLFTLAFVFDDLQALKMLEAGADAICVHLGFTQGGLLGAKKLLSLDEARIKAERILNICDEYNPYTIKLIYGGPIKNPIDVEYMFNNNSKIMGYIGGSSFERIPSEKAIINITKAFKKFDISSEEELMSKMMDGVSKHYDYTEFVKEYVAQNYMHKISFLELAKVAHVSRGYLSSLFKKDVGCGFPEYLVKFRINKAAEILRKENVSLTEVANMVGYKDYAQFSKMFKKYKGHPPILHKHKNT